MTLSEKPSRLNFPHVPPRGHSFHLGGPWYLTSCPDTGTLTYRKDYGPGTREVYLATCQRRFDARRSSVSSVPEKPTPGSCHAHVWMIVGAARICENCGATLLANDPRKG